MMSKKISRAFRIIFNFPFYVKKAYKLIYRTDEALNYSKGNFENKIIINKAIVVHVSGGLANQMICYKAGRYLSAIKKVPLILDATFYRETEEGKTNRNFQLIKFPIKYDLLIYDLSILIAIKKDNLIHKIDAKLLKDRNEIITKIPKEFIDFDLIELNIWSSLAIRKLADQFAKENVILTEFKLIPEIDLDSQNKVIYKIIKSKRNPVAVHIRRGDFIQNEGGQAVVLTFFISAINKMETLCQDPFFFIFSDDIKWCKTNLTSANLLFADINDERNGYKDLFLAAQCKHFILTQASTFGHQILELNNNEENRIVIKSKDQDKLRNQNS
ncbi:MAG: hypothetical protein ACI93N_001495 [Flavobacteriaceae bacterium]|jgi:hypothetical protein